MDRVGVMCGGNDYERELIKRLVYVATGDNVADLFLSLLCTSVSCIFAAIIIVLSFHLCFKLK